MRKVIQTMLPGLSDVYVLAPQRSAEVVGRFLETFASERKFSAHEFVVHEAEGQDRLFSDCDDAIEFCAESTGSSGALYWRNLAPPSEHVMVFFLADAHLVLGMSTSEQEAPGALAKLKRFCGEGANGYVTFEEPPADNALEFLQRCRQYDRRSGL